MMNMKDIKALFVGCLLALFFAKSAFAASDNSLDTQLLPSKVLTLKNATLEHTESKSVRRYLLPLGAMIKINGKWRSKKHDILTGELTRTTYLLEDDDSFNELRNLDGSISLGELYQYYLQQLNDQFAEILFECKGRNCGSSNQWGNGFVDNKRMVGRDRDQAYLAGRLASDQSNHTVSFVAIYMVKNVTGETRVHIDRLSQLNAQNNVEISSSKIASKNIGRILVIPTSELGQADMLERLNPIVQLLINNEDGVSLYLVGHAYGEQPIDALKETAKSYAKQLKRTFKQIDRSIGKQLAVEGLGPLAPESGKKDQLDRVELILH